MSQKNMIEFINTITDMEPADIEKEYGDILSSIEIRKTNSRPAPNILAILLDKNLIDLAKCIIRNGDTLSEMCGEIGTPAHKICRMRDNSLLMFCIYNGLAESLAMQDKNGDTPVHITARDGWPFGTECLLSIGAPLDIRNNNKELPEEVAKNPRISELFGKAAIKSRKQP